MRKTERPPESQETSDLDLMPWIDADPLATAAEVEWWRAHATKAIQKPVHCPCEPNPCQCRHAVGNKEIVS